MEGLDTQTSDLDEKEGLARAGENLASALSKQATKAIAAEAEGATQEAIHALRAETQNAAVRWIVKHGPALVDFAKERHLYWLVKFVDFFNN